MRSPVLFLVFNRPETTRQVFEAIRAARPPKLYVAADGPRTTRADDAKRCAEVHAIVSAVDWPCQVITLFRDHNLGCKLGVASGITWFFDHETEGIILEDDVLPVTSFFDYCDELLERYRDDDRVIAISGSNLVAHQFNVKESYIFSRYNCIWGWATWQRAWKHYDVAMSAWPSWRDSNGLASISDGSKPFEFYWRKLYDSVHAGKIDTWDYQWAFTSWRMKGLTALPSVNQTFNLGFGIDATHTIAEIPNYVLESRPQLLQFPLSHPFTVKRNEAIDAAIDSQVLGIGLIKMLRARLSNIPALKMLVRRFSSK